MSEVQPPDPRALLAVLEAQQRSESATRAQLADAARDLARTRDVDDLQVLRAAEAYSDALDGFTRPNASAGYVFAALYATRRRVARWLGIPFVLLCAVAAAVWGYGAFEEAQRLDRMQFAARAQLKAARQKLEEAVANCSDLDHRVRSERPAPPNLPTLQKLLSELKDEQSSLGRALDEAEELTSRDERTVRRLRAVAQRITEPIEEFERSLNRTRELFLKGREILRVRGRLDAALAEAESMTPEPPLAEARAIHQRGLAALNEGAPETAAEHAHQLSVWVRNERESATIPDKLNGLLAQVKDLTSDAEILSRAAALHRQGRWAFDRSERLQAKEAVQLLTDLVGNLSQEFTLVMTGGKWRFKNSDPSARTYYVLVEAVAPNGAKLVQYVRNEEDGSGATVRVWGERVPFEIYERVRRDKQDNGRIDQNVFGRKRRGRLDLEMELRTDRGEIVPRTGQITRW